MGMIVKRLAAPLEDVRDNLQGSTQLIVLLLGASVVLLAGLLLVTMVKGSD